ncbi:Uncharacterised protein family UPF0546 [Plasmopara halstedii]|uniref:Uncharacterized protein family UPF0546 n=1 Tax=Plasmopara halstedii TaxID=4781 RepID=A0A0P1AAT1_PLAHL|nr:Uncharacterised protein family UPF0546 [Plasmopara halstedii]CEG37506.1 Uncharacterised protein family UPF0546 [Plasmopara halstedii]|eukprot:XP_024573875.1 Uncharacterised protein family UPF0546 [Plasmopara halstedii]
MNTPVSTLLSFLFVGALWGCTNPLIKRGSNDNVMYTRKDNSIEEFVKQFVGLVKNWQFLVPFALNQSGSVVYVYLLGSVDISNAVPISNSLTFVFTAITSRLLGEKPQRPRSTYTGMVLILLVYHINVLAMGSSSDESDDDFVPEADEEQDGDSINTSKAMDEHRSGTTDSHLDKLWDDMNASTSVSQTAAIKTSKLLNGLIKKTTRLADKKKKQKLHEFSIPILSVDVKRSRKDLAEETVIDRKMDRIIKFAGKEYTVASAASGTREKKGLDKVLESLDEPKKVSTMVKTSLDWDKFKEKEGIEDELTHYTKDGYLERQEFLQRLDLKRFELEKAERDKQRKLQQHSK